MTTKTTTHLHLALADRARRWLRDADKITLSSLLVIGLLIASGFVRGQADSSAARTIEAVATPHLPILLVATATPAPPVPTATPWPTAEPIVIVQQQIIEVTAEPPPAPPVASQDGSGQAQGADPDTQTATPDWYTDIATPEPAFVQAVIDPSKPDGPACYNPETHRSSPLCGDLTNAEAMTAVARPGGSGKTVAPHVGPIAPATGDDAAARWCAAAEGAGVAHCVEEQP